MNDQIPQELHELNIAQGKINFLMDDWEQLTDEERVEQMEQCINILQYPIKRIGDPDE